ncbi:MAG: hypothetical protein QM756_30115 [Polyangiaceae bacterium]
MSILESVRSSLVFSEAAQQKTLRVSGKDAKSWLNGLVTCDVAEVGPGRGTFGLLLTKQGEIVTELSVLGSNDGLLLGMGNDAFDAVSALLDRYLVMEDVELEAAPNLSWLRLVGPGSDRTVMSGVVASGGIDWLRLGGAAWLCEAQSLSTIEHELQGLGATRANEDDWRLLRLAHGFPEFGVDYGPDDNPHEASLERRAVSWSKGCYLGQEVVCMQDMRGRVKRRLVALELDAAPPPVGSEVRAVGEVEPVGRVTSSAADGPRAFCIASVRAPFFEGSRGLEVLNRPARIVAPTSAG